MSAHEGSVQYRAQGGVAFLTFDRPAARNAMTWRMYDELAEGLGRVEVDPAVRVAVLRGAGGKAFIAGTAIEQFEAFDSGEDGIAYETKIDRYVDALERVRVPTIAVIEGLAVGGGLAIANACDLRIAATGSRFGVPIARTVGNTLSAANLRRLTSTLGVSVVKRMLLLAEMPTAEALQPLGYFAELVPAESLDAAVASVCERLLGHAPITMRASRELLRRLAADPAADDTDLIRECYGSDDFRAGVRAFKAKAKVVWTGQ